MFEFDVDKIYRKYTDAYHRCIGIAMSLEELAIEHPDFAGVTREYWMLRRDGDDAYSELLVLYHKLSMCISLDIASVRAQLSNCGVFVGDDDGDGKTIQTELKL